MRHLSMLGVLASLSLVLGGCFNYSEPICSFSCGTGTGADLCPSNYECRTDGYCHKIGTTEACDFSDASVVQDLSAIPDQGPADLTSNDGMSLDEGPAPDLTSVDL